MSNYKELPSQEYLRECFDYDYNTGVLTWKARPLSHFNTQRGMKIRNSRDAGKPAGQVRTDGYIFVGLGGTKHMAHRLIHRLVTGDDPGYKQVDHINHTRSDNRWSNLRLVDGDRVNAKNKSRSASNTSGVTGVGWDKDRCKWYAQISVGGVRRRLGKFHSFDNAVAARKAAEREYGYHPNHGAAKAA